MRSNFLLYCPQDAASDKWYQCLKGRAISFHESPSVSNKLFNTKLIVSVHCSVRDFVTCLTSTLTSGENSTSAKRNRKVMLHSRQQDVLLCFYSSSKHRCMVLCFGFCCLQLRVQFTAFVCMVLVCSVAAILADHKRGRDSLWSAQKILSVCSKAGKQRISNDGCKSSVSVVKANTYQCMLD